MKYKLIALLFIVFLTCLICPASAWLSDYDYRMPIEINNTGNDLTYYQYNFTINTSALVSAGKMNVDGNDCRITNSTDVLLPFWNETAFNQSDTKIWVNATALGNVSNTIHYMYYGQANVSNVYNGTTTFEFFDDFINNKTHLFPYGSDTGWSSGFESTSRRIYFFGAGTDTLSPLSISQWVNIDTWKVGYSYMNPVVDIHGAGVIYHPTKQLFYIYGGTVGTNPVNTIYSFNTTTGNYTLLSETLPYSVFNPSPVLDPTTGKVYLFGGRQSFSGASQFINNISVHNLDFVTPNVTDTNANIPIAADGMSPSYSTENNKIYLFGGAYNNATSVESLDTILSYNSTTPSINPIDTNTSLATTVDTTATVYYNKSIYIFGGYSFTETQYYDTIQKYNVTANSIETLPQSLYKRDDDFHAFYDSVSEKIYIGPIVHSSGADNAEASKVVILEFNPETETLANEPFLGSTPTDWTTIGGSSIEHPKAIGGTYLTIPDRETDQYVGMYRNITEITGVSMLEYKATTANGLGNLQCYFGDNVQSFQSVVNIRNQQSTNWGLWRGTSNFHIISPIQYDYHIIGALIDEQAEHHWGLVDRSNKTGQFDWWYSSQALNQIQFNTATAGQSSIILDWVLIRKSTLTAEPTTSLDVEEELVYIPPNPTSLANTTGNFWVNYTWSPGSGNVTDSYNVSYNGTWDNSSSNNYRNESVGAHGYLNIIVYAYNSSGTGTLSASSLTDNVTIPNNVITISGVSASYTINEGETLSIDANYSDTDGDTGTFDDNSSVWNVDENMGLVSWVTVDGDDGTYNWYINITDGYGSTSTQEFTVTVNNSIYSPTITLVSFSPTPLNTNYTGATIISYMVNSSEPLNLSSLAFLHGVNYTITGDMHNYLSVPYNDISDGYYKAPYRNVTPYLSWEFNDTITEGNVWKWGGGDNDSSWITKTQINDTHTWINVTRMVPQSLSNAYFIHDEAVYNAPMTGFEINRQQGIILKGWDLDQIRNRNNNYFVNLFFDTSLESTLPTHPIEIGYCNNSYNPAVDDIDTCPNCTKFLEWNGTRWINHSWIPSTNASYASPLVINAQYFTDPSPDDIAYVWLRSYATSSKSFVLNATDYDPGLTNITFAETQSMWTYNELNGVTTPVAYTPSYFAMYTRDDEDFLHHLYIANDQGVWGHSDIFSEAIGVSSVPVSPVSFEHFNITHVHDEDYINDTFMDATYDAGSFDINIFCPADPDGGSVSHNLTLHYSDNQTFIAIINNTFTTTGNEYVDINFTTTPYYSSSNFYKLKCVSTDDEGSIATKWLISDFTLDADGNTGWIVDDKLLFWGMNDIPTLYTTISNNSLISYDGGSDVYTMHVPFFKSKFNDTFYFNETVYLESLNNENVSYFRFVGDTFFNYANIHAWNTTSSTLAPITDTYRGYVINYGHSCGYINNSNLSYLGSDLYRQEGLNFIENPHVFPINNTTLSHNAEGPIMEDCTNFIISNCTISDNANVGIGVYFSNDITIENNTITSNAGYSISVYEGFNNTISYNDISDGAPYGIRFWSGAGNNTCTGNDITGSASYDYYYSGDSFGNYLIDPASSTNKIRVTSTSSLNIENTDNAAFSEDSLNTSYAYLTNFSMYVSGVSQTFDITQHTATITPSTDKLSIWNLEWDDTLTFNVSSDTAINPTWFNITNTSWASGIVNIYINGTSTTTENADVNGLITYNYLDTYSEKWFEFQLSSVTPTPTPTVTPPPSGGSSSGTGTTGVGTSDEPLYNIDCRETGRIRNLQAGTETYYRTTKPDCTDIIKVTFTPTQNSPEQPILIEKLHNKSRFVTEDAPHTVYSYFNMYVGLFGFDEKTTNEKILFKVPINWTEVNNVTPESVTLYIFEPSTTSWKSLPTTLSHTDTLYYVYESESGATYGRFAIVGTDKVSLNIIEKIIEKIESIMPPINIPENDFISKATSLWDKYIVLSWDKLVTQVTDLYDNITNKLHPDNFSIDSIRNILDNEKVTPFIIGILSIILIAAITYFYNYEHGLIAGILVIILMIITVIVMNTVLISIMSVEAGNIIISTVAYTTIAFIISYIIGEKLK